MIYFRQNNLTRRMDGEIYKAVETNNPEELKALIARGANVNEFYHDYTLISAKSILHICCEKGRFECVKVNLVLVITSVDLN